MYGASAGRLRQATPRSDPVRSFFRSTSGSIVGYVDTSRYFDRKSSISAIGLGRYHPSVRVLGNPAVSQR
jgi:hypothetical protein